VKDFRGTSVKAFDKAGNYSLGIADQMIFVDLNLDRVEFRQGMNITFVFGNTDPDKTRAFLETIGMPFQRPDEQNRRGA
jgi:large subunit ribosomal protein L5